jgi:hypothetical protein
MSASEYRRLAAECLRISGEMVESRAVLVHMAQSWLALAQQARENWRSGSALWSASADAPSSTPLVLIRTASVPIANKNRGYRRGIGSGSAQRMRRGVEC